MCGSMADIRSAAAEIRRGKKRKKKEGRTNHSMKIYMVSLFHRATINKYDDDYKCVKIREGGGKIAEDIRIGRERAGRYGRWRGGKRCGVTRHPHH